MFEKIWARHVVAEGPGGHVLLYIDRHLLHEGTTAAFGALAFGIGSSEVEHVLATQTLWQKKPLTMRISVEGRLGPGVNAKDVILAIIAKIGAGGGVRHAIEYAGSTIRGMSMDERMTVCNMSIEAGARAGMIAPDETTVAYLEARPWAPRGEAWGPALHSLRAFGGDSGGALDRGGELGRGGIAPTL